MYLLPHISAYTALFVFFFLWINVALSPPKWWTYNIFFLVFVNNFNCWSACSPWWLPNLRRKHRTVIWFSGCRKATHAGLKDAKACKQLTQKTLSSVDLSKSTTCLSVLDLKGLFNWSCFICETQLPLIWVRFHIVTMAVYSLMGGFFVLTSQCSIVNWI